MRRRNLRHHPAWALSCLMLCITACSSTGGTGATATTGTSPATTATSEPARGTSTSGALPADAPLVDRLIAAYHDPVTDPSATAWRELAGSPTFASDPTTVFEFVRLHAEPPAKDRYDRFLAALGRAVVAAGGTVLGVNDTLFPGLAEPRGYDGGASWIASFPSGQAFAEAMVTPDMVAAAGERRDAVAEAQTVAGKNLIPAPILNLPPQKPAADYPSARVAGKSPGQVVDELLQVYPDGGADPTRSALRQIVDFKGFQDQRIAFINLYQFNEGPNGGSTSLNEYNAQALPIVLAHGGRPKAVVNIEHHLVGPTAWSRIIYIQWPSLAVLTDLRLDPAYLQAQTHRVVSSDVYGNLVGIPRPDQ